MRIVSFVRICGFVRMWKCFLVLSWMFFVFGSLFFLGMCGLNLV